MLILCTFTGVLFAYLIAGWRGKSGMAVVTGIMGVLLAAMVPGMISDGIGAMIAVLAGRS